MKAVLLYDSAEDVMITAPVHFPAHKARIDEFQARGILEAISLSAVLAALAWLVFVKALGLPMSVWPEGMAN